MLISEDQYYELLDTKIADLVPKIAGVAKDSSEFGTFANYGSWAIWKDISVNPGLSAKDPSAVNRWKAVSGIALSNAVLIAYNLGQPKNSDEGSKKDDAGASKSCPWENFHSGRSDYRLAQGTQDTVFRGAWITDFFKAHPSNTIAEMKESTRNLGNQELEEQMKLILDQQLRILGAEEAPLIALGRDTEDVLRRVYGPNRSIHFVPHYSSRASNSNTYGDNFRNLEHLVHYAE